MTCLSNYAASLTHLVFVELPKVKEQNIKIKVENKAFLWLKFKTILTAWNTNESESDEMVIENGLTSLDQVVPHIKALDVVFLALPIT